MKADQVVYIGTTRETIESLIAAMNNMTLTNNGNSVSERRESITSVQSNTSVANSNSSVSKPPTYSQLSKVSSPSLEACMF